MCIVNTDTIQYNTINPPNHVGIHWIAPTEYSQMSIRIIWLIHWFKIEPFGIFKGIGFENFGIVEDIGLGLFWYTYVYSVGTFWDI